MCKLLLSLLLLLSGYSLLLKKKNNRRWRKKLVSSDKCKTALCDFGDNTSLSRLAQRTTSVLLRSVLMEVCDVERCFRVPPLQPLYLSSDSILLEKSGPILHQCHIPRILIPTQNNVSSVPTLNTANFLVFFWRCWHGTIFTIAPNTAALTSFSGHSPSFSSWSSTLQKPL